MALNEKYKEIVQEHAAGAAAIGIPGAFVPGIDVAGIAGIWANMLVKIAKKSGHPVTHTFMLKYATSIATGVTGYIAGSKIFGMLLHMIPGIGTVFSVGINSFLNYMFTYRLGKMTSNLMDREDFDLGDFANVTTNIVLPLVSVPSVSEVGEMISAARGL